MRIGENSSVCVDMITGFDVVSLNSVRNQTHYVFFTQRQTLVFVLLPVTALLDWIPFQLVPPTSLLLLLYYS